MDVEGFIEGSQLVLNDWKKSSEKKRRVFKKVKEITGHLI
jgi:hypothetical protein